MYFALFLQAKDQFLDCSEFIKLNFTCADSLEVDILAFPVDVVKEKVIHHLCLGW